MIAILWLIHATYYHRYALYSMNFKKVVYHVESINTCTCDYADILLKKY
jgi:hypothetical protein